MTAPRALLGTARHIAGTPHRLARLATLRDLDAWLRLSFLGVMSQTGLASALARSPRAVADVAAEAGCTDTELLESFLDLGVSLGELRVRGARYAIKGRRLRAVASGDADDLAGLVEEVISYDGPIYQHLAAHLAGAPRADYLAGAAEAIARASRLVEPVIGPFLEELVRERSPRTILDVGTGSGVNLRWMALGAPAARLTGIDIEPDAIATATVNVDRWGIAARCAIVEADVNALPPDHAGPFDLVVLAQNIYYWPPAERGGVLAGLRALATDRLVVISATPARLPFSRHLDLVLRVTERNWRLPTADELRADARSAGFTSTDVRQLAPGSGMVALVAS